MSFEEPKITVLIPAFNAQAFLHEALDSICNQDFDDFECLIVNDGSTDSTPEIIDQYVNKDRRFRVINKNNGGILTAMNVGLEAAKGKYIARMDTDDVSMPHRLRLQAKVLDKSPECVLVSGGIELIDMDGSFMSTDHPPLNDIDIRQSLYCGNPLYHPSVMFRKEEMLKAGGYIGGEKAEHCEDFHLWLRLADIGKIAAVPQVVLRYRINPDSLTAKYRVYQDQMITAMIDRLWDSSKPQIVDHSNLRDTLIEYGNIQPHSYARSVQTRVLNDCMELVKQFWKRGHSIAATKQFLNILFSGRKGFIHVLRALLRMLLQIPSAWRAEVKNPWAKARERTHV